MQKNDNKRSEQYTLISYVTQDMYDELTALLTGSQFQSLSELCRDIIDGKRIEGTFYRCHPDKLLSDLTTTYKGLQKRCSEIDQLTKMIDGEQSPEGLMMLTMAIRQIFVEVNELLGPMQALMTSISLRWIPDEEPCS